MGKHSAIAQFYRIFKELVSRLDKRQASIQKSFRFMVAYKMRQCVSVETSST